MEVGQTSISFKHATAIGSIANENAESALSQAQSAQKAGDDAKTAAETAATKATEALTAANDAQESVETGIKGVSDDIDAAKTTANSALSTATDAQTKVTQLDTDTTAKLTTFKEGLDNKVSKGELSTEVTQLTNAIGLKANSKDVTSEITAAVSGVQTTVKDTKTELQTQITQNAEAWNLAINRVGQTNLVYNSQYRNNGNGWTLTNGAYFSTSSVSSYNAAPGYGINISGKAATDTTQFGQSKPYAIPDTSVDTTWNVFSMRANGKIYSDSDAGAKLLITMAFLDNTGTRVGFIERAVDYSTKDTWATVKAENFALPATATQVCMQYYAYGSKVHGMVTEPMIVHDSTVGPYNADTVGQADITASINNIHFGFKNPDGSQYTFNMGSDGTAVLDFSNIYLNGTTNIKAGTIGTAQIADAAIGTAQVSTIAANKISAASLSAISANLGAITAGSPVNGIYPFEVAANGSVATHSLTLDNAYNLVYNSEFYANGIEWDARSGFETSPTGVVLEGQGHDGSNAIGLTTSNADFHSQHRMPELQGKTISVSIWVKANATADTIDLVLSDENMGGQVLTSHEVHHTTSGNWELLKLENLAIEGNNSVLYVRVRNATQAGAYYGLISQPLIVQQSTAGTYVPSSSITGGWIVDSHIVNSDIDIYDNGNITSLKSGELTLTDGTNSVSLSPLALQMANNSNGNDVTVSPGSVEITNTKGNVTVSDGNIYANPQGNYGGTTHSLITGNLIVGGTGHRIFTTDVGGIYFGKDTSSPEILHAAKLATYSLASIKTDITRYDDDDALQSVLDTDIYSWRHAAHPEKFVQISPIIDDTGEGYKMGKDVLDDDGETINNNNMIGLLFGAVKALNAKIDAK